MKGLVTRNAHVRYESYICTCQKSWSRLNIFVHADDDAWGKTKALPIFVPVSSNYDDIGLVTTNIHKQYESHVLSVIKTMAWVRLECFFFTKISQSYKVKNYCYQA